MHIHSIHGVKICQEHVLQGNKVCGCLRFPEFCEFCIKRALYLMFLPSSFYVRVLFQGYICEFCQTWLLLLSTAPSSTGISSSSSEYHSWACFLRYLSGDLPISLSPKDKGDRPRSTSSATPVLSSSVSDFALTRLLLLFNASSSSFHHA